jgi:hypothetical protein
VVPDHLPGEPIQETDRRVGPAPSSGRFLKDGVTVAPQADGSHASARSRTTVVGRRAH